MALNSATMQLDTRSSKMGSALKDVKSHPEHVSLSTKPKVISSITSGAVIVKPTNRLSINIAKISGSPTSQDDNRLVLQEYQQVNAIIKQRSSPAGGYTQERQSNKQYKIVPTRSDIGNSTEQAVELNRPGT